MWIFVGWAVKYPCFVGCVSGDPDEPEIWNSGFQIWNPGFWIPSQFDLQMGEKNPCISLPLVYILSMTLIK